MDEINSILKGFDKVDFIKFDSINWMNRKETKFVLPFASLPQLLTKLKNDYGVVYIDGKFNFAYKTVYFDTQNFDMYHSHHNGRATRFKVRERVYAEPDSEFLEVKKKNNKGQTIKDRVLIDPKQDKWFAAECDFIRLKTPYDPLALFPALSVKYSRIILVNKKFNEKVTIDFDLEFLNETNSYKTSKLVIVELKQLSVLKTPAFLALKDLRVKPLSFSKYCFGISNIYPRLKKNNFKQKLVTLKKIINDVPIYLTPGI